MADVTQILNGVAQGDRQAAAELLPLVYAELRKLAAQKLAGERPGQTLNATALVHEAYLRLVPTAQESEPHEAGSGRLEETLGYDDRQWDNRGHFFAAAAEAMRRILIEAARAKGRLKRGGDRDRVPLDDIALPDSQDENELIALDEALTKLAAIDPEAAQLVQLRFFSGLSIADAARFLRISPRTADRLWSYARAFIHSELADA